MRILCVDFGNVCRGPMAEAVLRRRSGGRFFVASAGVDVVTPGDRPDPRAVEVATRRGYRLDGITCTPFEMRFFDEFDRMLAVDRWVLRKLMAMRPQRSRAHAGLMHPEGVEIADPYEGAQEDFARALALIEDAAEGVVTMLGTRHRFLDERMAAPLRAAAWSAVHPRRPRAAPEPSDLGGTVLISPWPRRA